MSALPVGAVVPAVCAALAQQGAAVLQAPPGAGKTTLVPLALREEPWLEGRQILMLEPRRLAARAAARRMAEMRGEAVGESVGYRTRLESRIGPRTRLTVLTEGILIRMLQEDPTLEDAGLVIFDEFHERSLDADLGLALTLEARRLLRPDLRLLVMSATLDGAAVARLMGDAPVVTSHGQSFPVHLHYLGRPQDDRLAAAVASAVHRALRETPGSVLVFLPGGAEIRRVARLLAAAETVPADVAVLPLYGDLPQAAQDAALAPPPAGRRKVVLATPIAETSLTIEGISAVVDSGLAREPRFEPHSGMSRLETRRISQASAEQRRGRAGRLGPGLCYRLWSEAEQAQLRPFAAPEIRDADLAPLALTIAVWGTDAAALSWLDPPPAPAYAEARALLQRLGAFDQAGRVTRQGQAMAALGLHPRLAHLVLQGKAWGIGTLASALAALLGERDILKAGADARDADLRLRVEMVLSEDAARALPRGLVADRAALRRVAAAMRQTMRRLGLRDSAPASVAETGRLVAQAYPDRIGQRRAGAPGQFRLANGRGAVLPAADPLAAEEFLAISDLDGERRAARIFLAAPLARAALEQDFADQIETIETVGWDDRAAAVLARRRRQLDALVLSDEPIADAPADKIAAALLTGIRALGLACLPWQETANSLRARIGFLRRLEGAAAGWPDLSDATLLATLETWLAPALAGITRRAEFDRIDLAAALAALLTPEQRRTLDRLAPPRLVLPSGLRVAVDYGEAAPIVAVRLQALFGTATTPTVAAGRVPVVLHLLSPAGRPLQVTSDLAGFWRGSYPEVRRAMRGRYPRHPWPEDPLHAAPAARGVTAPPQRG